LSEIFLINVDSQTLEQFKVRLAQTIFWCASRADNMNPATSLRTTELRPRQLEENRSSAVDTVAHARELFGGVDIRNATIPSSLGGGRLLIYFPNHDLACGAAEQETAGFFDINNVPPWDTWVAYFQDEQPNIDSFDTEYLIAWVPSVFVGLANDGIDVNPEQCIQWLSDTSVELARALRAENLLR
jgi:hypothetical protein